MGVITTQDVRVNTLFGPIPTGLMIADPAYLIGNMTTDKLPEIPLIHINVNEACKQHRFVEWIPYLRSARCDKEQNLELIREWNGDIIYRVTREILAGEELLIWFSERYCRDIGFELIPRKPLVCDGEDDAVYKCENCSSSFRYLYPLFSHLLFKCALTKSSPLAVSPHRPLLTPLRESIHHHPTNLRIPTTVTNVCPPPPPAPLSGSNKQLRLDNNASTLSTAELVVRNLCPPTPLMNSADDAGANAVLGKELAAYSAWLKSSTSAAVVTATHHPPHPHHQYQLQQSSQSQLSSQHPLFQSLRDTGNPMVHKLLQSIVSSDAELAVPVAQMKLAQNWCAECNTTFRMTSDLVYHMRTHHKNVTPTTGKQHDSSAESSGGAATARSGSKWHSAAGMNVNASGAVTLESSHHHHSSSSKRLRVSTVAAAAAATDTNNKRLMCDICGEKFRERHHLSRHMASHL